MPRPVPAEATIHHIGESDEYVDVTVHHPGGDVKVRLYPNGRSEILDMGADYRSNS